MSVLDTNPSHIQKYIHIFLINNFLVRKNNTNRRTNICISDIRKGGVEIVIES